MDVVLMVLYIVIVLSVLVFIHEGGHFLAARAFGVRVTEFMLGLPGPNIGFTWRGTKFGVTAVPLGGYAKVCGMEPGPEDPHLEDALAFAYANGTVYADDVAEKMGITLDEAIEALYVLEEWGCLVGPKKTDEHNVFRTHAFKDKRKGIDLAEGSSRPFDDAHELYLAERAQTYRAQPFWKRCVILLAGIFMNLLFAIVAFVLIYSVFGIDMVNEAGEVVRHVNVDVGTAISAGFNYIGMVAVAVAGLFNPQTAADTVSNSTSVMGMAVLSKQYADAGPLEFLFFMSMISVSLGIMNLLPIPPLDGGRFVIEIFQKLTKRQVGYKAMNIMTMTGMALFIGFFILMLNQDIQRFIFGNW